MTRILVFLFGTEDARPGAAAAFEIAKLAHALLEVVEFLSLTAPSSAVRARFFVVPIERPSASRADLASANLSFCAAERMAFAEVLVFVATLSTDSSAVLITNEPPVP